MTRYLALRFLCQVSLGNDEPMRNVLVYNQIVPEGDPADWDMANLTADDVGVDALRYAFAKSYSALKQKTVLSRGLLLGGRKLVYLVGNLRKLFLKHQLAGICFPTVDEAEYVSAMERFSFGSVLEDVESGFRRLSRDIQVAKDNGSFEREKIRYFQTYLRLVKKLTPICPSICVRALSAIQTNE